jgi:hypothetical protein
MTPTTRALAPLAALFLTLALACSNDTDDPPPSSTSTTVSPEAEVEAAYLAYWDMAEQLSAAPDPANSEISKRAVDPVRETLTETLSSYQAEGQLVHSGPDYGHEVSEVVVDGDSATLLDCALDDSALIDEESGETIRQEVVTTSLQAVLVLQDDRWLLKELNALGSWEGAVPCE